MILPGAHCRAGANFASAELTFDEAQTFIQGIKVFGAPYPLFILTGGIQPNVRHFRHHRGCPRARAAGGDDAVGNAAYRPGDRSDLPIMALSALRLVWMERMR